MASCLPSCLSCYGDRHAGIADEECSSRLSRCVRIDLTRWDLKRHGRDTKLFFEHNARNDDAFSKDSARSAKISARTPIKRRFNMPKLRLVAVLLSVMFTTPSHAARCGGDFN